MYVAMACRRGEAELGALSDRALHDLGVDRGGIMYAARYGRGERRAPLRWLLTVARQSGCTSGIGGHVITQAQADQFGKDWIEAWNSHDLDRVLSHYSEDFVMSSPHIAAIAGEPSGVLKGKRAVGDYWKQALSRIPDLHFELLATFAGADSVAIHYNGARGPAIEVLFFDASGLVDRAAVHYLPKRN